VATIGAKVESAYSQLITGLGISGLNVYTGIGNEEKEAPAAIISALSATEDFPQSGIWHVKTRILVKNIAADTEEQGADSMADTVFAACLASNVSTTLETFGGFKIFDLFIETSEQDEAGDAWGHSINLEVICAIGSA
jgi:hypothetical protein